MELGKKIKSLRLRAGFTQEQLAEQLGIGAQSVSKWENAVAMPDILLLPLLSEIFGVSIDELFDLSVEQRLNRMENRLEAEEELPADVYSEYEDFLTQQRSEPDHKTRATELSAFLYWHRMNAYAQKVNRYAKEAIRNEPNKKGCQWMLQMSEGHVAWDWNVSNHRKAIEFYRELAADNPDDYRTHCYLIENLIADRRTAEAEECLARLRTMKDAEPHLLEVYRAHIALARFDEQGADRIIEELLRNNPDNWICLFEAAQYYAGKCEYEKAIDCYERSYANEPRKPRYIDNYQGIADIYEIMGNYEKAADTYGRTIDLLQNEWGMNEECLLTAAKEERVRLLEKAKIMTAKRGK